MPHAQSENVVEFQFQFFAFEHNCTFISVSLESIFHQLILYLSAPSVPEECELFSCSRQSALRERLTSSLKDHYFSCTGIVTRHHYLKVNVPRDLVWTRGGRGRNAGVLMCECKKGIFRRARKVGPCSCPMLCFQDLRHV